MYSYKTNSQSSIFPKEKNYCNSVVGMLREKLKDPKRRLLKVNRNQTKLRLTLDANADPYYYRHSINSCSISNVFNYPEIHRITRIHILVHELACTKQRNLTTEI